MKKQCIWKPVLAATAVNTVARGNCRETEADNGCLPSIATFFAQIRRCRIVGRRNLLLGGDGNDRLSQLIAQMTTLSNGLGEIKIALTDGVAKLSAQAKQDAGSSGERSRAEHHQFETAIAHLTSFNDNLAKISAALSNGATRPQDAAATESLKENVEAAFRQFESLVERMDPSTD